MAKVGAAIKEMGNNVVTLLVFALILGSLVSSTAFTALTILNVSTLTAALVTFFGAIVGFIGIVGTFIGLRWLISAIRGSGKNDSITNIAA